MRFFKNTVLFTLVTLVLFGQTSYSATKGKKYSVTMKGGGTTEGSDTELRGLELLPDSFELHTKKVAGETVDIATEPYVYYHWDSVGFCGFKFIFPRTCIFGHWEPVTSEQEYIRPPVEGTFNPDRLETYIQFKKDQISAENKGLTVKGTGYRGSARRDIPLRLEPGEGYFTIHQQKWGEVSRGYFFEAKWNGKAVTPDEFNANVYKVKLDSLRQFDLPRYQSVLAYLTAFEFEVLAAGKHLIGQLKYRCELSTDRHCTVLDFKNENLVMVSPNGKVFPAQPDFVEHEYAFDLIPWAHEWWHQKSATIKALAGASVNEKDECVPGKLAETYQALAQYKKDYTLLSSVHYYQALERVSGLKLTPGAFAPTSEKPGADPYLELKKYVEDQTSPFCVSQNLTPMAEEIPLPAVKTPKKTILKVK